jgi:hypothetical protein
MPFEEAAMFEIMTVAYILGLLLPPAAVVVGALFLAIPRGRRFGVSHRTRHAAHA